MKSIQASVLHLFLFQTASSFIIDNQSAIQLRNEARKVDNLQFFIMAKRPIQQSFEENDINNDVLMQMESDDSDDLEDSLLI